MDRHIACLTIPRFEIALACLEDPCLRNRPVAVASYHTPRARLQEVSHEAENEGIVAGLPVYRARRLCPSLHVLPPNPSRVHQAHQIVLKSVRKIAPLWETDRPGHLFLDLTGTTRLFGQICDTIAQLKRDIAHQYQLKSVAGIGSNKLVAHIATTLLVPSQLCDVRPGSEQTFLAPLPISVLPSLNHLQNPNIQTTLTDLNLRTLGALAELPLDPLESVLGREALLLHNWACGIDPSPVLLPSQRPRLEVSCMLEPDEIDEARLAGTLYELVEDLCRELRIQQRVCHRFTLTLHYSDQISITRRHSIVRGTYWEVDMFPHLKALFHRCFQRRVRVHALTVTAEELQPPDGQLSLFDDENPPSPWPSPSRGEGMGGGDFQVGLQHKQRHRPHRLALTLDHIRTRFGRRAIWFGYTKH